MRSTVRLGFISDVLSARQPLPLLPRFQTYLSRSKMRFKAHEETYLAYPVTTGVHLCRGNSMGRWLADGGYDKIAEKLFNELRCDRLLLQYDSPQAGDFAPLRFVPKNKIVVLGLITTKHGELETADELVRRVDETARYLPVEQLALSPQCGFASSGRGNPLTEEEQWRKLELASAVAETVWKH
jgi:5-methyltetrahydropteroyltriglutamate--homocysteine methyltransferase